MKISGRLVAVCIRWSSLAFGLGVALVPPAASQSPSRLTGDYVCAYGCRLTDANPSIKVKGGEVDCVNEYGGLFQGKLIGTDGVACWDMFHGSCLASLEKRNDEL